MARRSITSTAIRSWLRRAALTVLGMQAITVAVLLWVDGRRKRLRAPASFPRITPQHVSIEAAEVTLFTYGQDLYDAMLADIRQARHAIKFETYLWKSDRTGRIFKQALTEAAERGVEVYVVYDVFANLVVPQNFFHFVPEIHVLRHPIITKTIGLPSARTLGRNHNKLLVVDSGIAYVGGYNIGKLYATDWRDTHVRLTGSVVADLEDTFNDYWNMMRPRDRQALPNVPNRDWRAFAIRVHRNVPGAMHYPIRGMYLEAIDRAADHIYLTHAYLIPDDDFLRTLTAAARRGVDVRIIVPEASNHIVADWISRGFYGQLLRSGVRLFLFQGAMVHAKTATIDGQWSTIGTANLDRLSLDWNYELNVEITDRAVAVKMEDMFAIDESNSVELRWAQWSRRHLAVKFSETILRPFRNLF